jgi:hypothetical protein
MGKIFFLVFLTFQPNGFVKHEYIGMHASAAKCLDVARQIMEPEFMDWQTYDTGCTTIAPVAGGNTFWRAKADITETDTFFISP